MDSICGRFNSRREGKLLTILNEVRERQSKKNADVMKSIITDCNFQVERKGLEAYDAECRLNLASLSNNFYMDNPSNSDRRHALKKCCSDIRDSNYFDKLADILTDELALYFFNLLCRVDITKWNKRKIPNTKYRNELIVLYKSNCLIHFLTYFVKKHFRHRTMVSMDQLYSCWEDWSKKNGYQNIFCKINFVKNLKIKYDLIQIHAQPTICVFHYENDDDFKIQTCLCLSELIINDIFINKLKQTGFSLNRDWFY